MERGRPLVRGRDISSALLSRYLGKSGHLPRACISGEISKSELDTTFLILPHFFSTGKPAILPARAEKSAGKFELFYRVLTIFLLKSML